MSKAFTSGDEAPESPLGALPVGRRPITEGGLLRLKRELKQLTDSRAALLGAAADGDAEARSRLRTVDWGAEVLARKIALSDCLPLDEEGLDRVRFGAQALVRDEDGSERRYTIVGPDEIDGGRGHVSHVSPIGRTLLGLAVGEWATIKRPAGDLEVQVVAIERP